MEARGKTNRRGLLAGAAGAGGLAAGMSLGGGWSALAASSEEAAGEAADGCAGPIGPIEVGPDDPRYAHLAGRGSSLRFTSSPDYVEVVGSASQVAAAVERAVAAGKRLVVRGGGHCFEDFVDNPETEVIIDTSGMKAVYFDAEHDAFAIEAGATLGEVYHRLFMGWGVTVPGGTCPEVGVGGHVPGGGYGPLSRALGTLVDHLYAVEVVTVDDDGSVRTTVATREQDDPDRDLWWAHTGGGGGSFGIVTRYWMRTPGASGEPERLLPEAPAEQMNVTLQWNWEDLDRESFERIVSQHGRWHTEHSAPGARENGVYSVLMLSSRIMGPVMLNAMSVAENAEELLADYTAAVSDGVAAPFERVERVRPWLAATLGEVESEDAAAARMKLKAGYLREAYDDRQIGVLWEFLSTELAESVPTTVVLRACGGEVNAVEPDATAVAHRDSVLKAIHINAWDDAGHDEFMLDFSREFYAEIYADSGGVPVPGERYDGSFINYPDMDLADPELNVSGTAWHELYFKDNYPRLQRVKRAWDPRDVFRHGMSIRLPD